MTQDKDNSSGDRSQQTAAVGDRRDENESLSLASESSTRTPDGGAPAAKVAAGWASVALAAGAEARKASAGKQDGETAIPNLETPTQHARSPRDEDGPTEPAYPPVLGQRLGAAALALAVLGLVVAGVGLWQQQDSRRQLRILEPQIQGLRSTSQTDPSLNANAPEQDRTRDINERLRRLETQVEETLQELGAGTENTDSASVQPMETRGNLVAARLDAVTAHLARVDERLLALERTPQQKPPAQVHPKQAVEPRQKPPAQPSPEQAAETQPKPPAQPSSKKTAEPLAKFPAQPPPPKQASGLWAVNIASFSKEAIAQQELGRLHELGIKAEIRTVEKNGQTWFRLSVIGFSSQAQAREYAGKLKLIPQFGKAYDGVWIGKN